MKKIIVLTVALLITALGIFAQEKAGRKDTVQHPAIYTCPMHPEITSSKPGKCPKCGMTLVAKKMGMEKKIYTCPMHPEVINDKPGKCPKCGMDLVEKKVAPSKKMKDSSVKMR